MTAPGVGVIVGLTYSSAIDDPGRFRSSRAVGAHFGLTPKKYQADVISAGLRYCAFLEWPTCSSSDPIRWRPSADPGQKRDLATGSMLRAIDHPTARDRGDDNCYCGQ